MSDLKQKAIKVIKNEGYVNALDDIMGIIKNGIHTPKDTLLKVGMFCVKGVRNARKDIQDFDEDSQIKDLLD